MSGFNSANNANNNSVPLFEFNDACVRRCGKTILHINKFKLNQGENVVLLGPNGAGKSTFINLITREVKPLYKDVPPVKFLGNPRAQLTEIKKQVGIVSAVEQEQVKVHLPAVEVVEGGLFGTVGLPRNTKPTAKTRQLALNALERLGVASIASQDILTLSSGQARRVLFARALIHNPKTIVLDEPCTGLDPQGMFYVRKSMRKLAAEGVTVILISHYAEDIIPEINRVVLIKNGRLYADGSKDELVTSEKMSALFEIPINVCKTGKCGQYYSLVSEY